MAALSESPWADRKHPDVLCLFDVDGTLTLARRVCLRLRPLGSFPLKQRNTQKTRDTTAGHVRHAPVPQGPAQEGRHWLCRWLGPGQAEGAAGRKRYVHSWLVNKWTLSVVLILVIELFDYAFPENGLQAYRKGHLLTSEVSARLSVSSNIRWALHRALSDGLARKSTRPLSTTCSPICPSSTSPRSAAPLSSSATA